MHIEIIKQTVPTLMIVIGVLECYTVQFGTNQIKVSVNKTVVHILCYEKKVIKCQRNVGVMYLIFQQDVILTFSAVRPPALE
jgi:hypothetical protein